MKYFNQIMTTCQEIGSKYGQFDSLLSLIIILEEDSQVVKEWQTIIQYQDPNQDFHYLKIDHSKGNTRHQETQIPFGYAPFSSIAIDFEEAYHLAKQKVDSTCSTFKLYFPLSPFDTEPLWNMIFLNNVQINVGAETGRIEVIEY